MPIRSGAMQRPNGSRCGNTLRQRYDEVGLPCSSTMGSPLPTSTYAIWLPRIPRRCFLYGNTAEIILAFPTFLYGYWMRASVTTSKTSPQAVAKRTAAGVYTHNPVVSDMAIYQQ